jgi:ABC-type nickel/cobalt efflux system permease component RcnA
MNWLPVFTGPLRALLAALGATLVARGYFSAEQSDQIIGALLVIIPACWSAWQNYRQQQHIQHAAETGVIKPPAI